jgi:hypothetical protein
VQHISTVYRCPRCKALYQTADVARDCHGERPAAVHVPADYLRRIPTKKEKS